MSIPNRSETREYTRLLTLTQDRRVPGIKQNAYDFDPLMSIFLGRINQTEMGPTRMNGRGKKTQEGGASVEITHQLGKNATVKTLTSMWDTVDTTPQQIHSFSRANWSQYSATATVAEMERLVQRGGAAIGSIVDTQVGDAIRSTADTVAGHLFNNGGDATRATSLQQVVSAGDTLQGVSGTTYTRWNSRGFSARETLPASVTFDGGTYGTSDSFAAAGLVNLRTLHDNCSEGSIQPHFGITTYTIWAAYEASLQAQQRFTTMNMGDGAFQALAFDTAPIFKSPKCTSGELYFINVDATYVIVLGGADFEMTEFHPAELQEAYSSKCMAKLQLVCENRLLNNKWTGATA